MTARAGFACAYHTIAKGLPQEILVNSFARAEVWFQRIFVLANRSSDLQHSKQLKEKLLALFFREYTVIVRFRIQQNLLT